MEITAKSEALQKARDTIQLKSLDLGFNWRQSRKLDRLVFDLFELEASGYSYSGLSREELNNIRENRIARLSKSTG